MIKDNQDNDIKVSVFCLAYNHEKYIRQTLEGFVLQKTNFNYEVIIHDDASSDNTPQIIKEYSEKYPEIIKPIYQTENQYSKGIEIISSIMFPVSKGKYLAFCEGDDYWNDPLKIQKQYDALEAHSECSMSTHKVQCCNEDGSLNCRLIPEKKYDINSDQILSPNGMIKCLYEKGGYPFHTSSYFIRREAFIYDLDYPRDQGVLRRALINGDILYIDAAMSTRRLWSLNNWNSRLKTQGDDGRIKLIVSDLKYEPIFDIVTERKYHKIIYRSIIKKILFISLKFGKHETAKNLLIEYRIEKKDIIECFKSRRFVYLSLYWIIMNVPFLANLNYCLYLRIKLICNALKNYNEVKHEIQ